jgi:hypothetical protein
MTSQDSERFYDDEQNSRYGRHIVTATAAAAAAYAYHQLRLATQADMARVDLNMKVVEKRSEKGDFATFINTGMFQNPESVLEHVAGSLHDLGTVSVLRHGPDMENNRDTALELLEREAGRRILWISMSKGAVDYQRLKADPVFAAESADAEAEIHDSAVFSLEHMTRRGAIMFQIGRATPENILGEVVYRKLNTAREDKMANGSVRDINPGAFYIAHSAAKTFATHEYETGSVREAYVKHKVGHVVMMSSRNDKLVNTEASGQWLADESGHDVIYAVDPDRPEGHHAGFPKFPRFMRATIDMLTSGDEIPFKSDENQESPYSLLTPQKPVY